MPQVYFKRKDFLSARGPVPPIWHCNLLQKEQAPCIFIQGGKDWTSKNPLKVPGGMGSKQFMGTRVQTLVFTVDHENDVCNSSAWIPTLNSVCWITLSVEFKEPSFSLELLFFWKLSAEAWHQPIEGDRIQDTWAAGIPTQTGQGQGRVGQTLSAAPAGGVALGWGHQLC